jgi:hypothetical protein
MQLYPATKKTPLKLDVPYRRGEKLDYTAMYDVPAWTANTVIRTGAGVRPTTRNGFFYIAKDGGKTDDTEPSWVADEGEETEDNTVTWVAYDDDALLEPNETISSSTWTADDGVTLGADTYASADTDTASKVWIVGITDDVTDSFELTHTVTTSNTPPRILVRKFTVTVVD